MKQTIILWIAAGVLTFLAGFLQSRTSPNYPINGTIGIEGKKVSYHLEKIHKSKDEFKIIIQTEIENLMGVLAWRTLNSSDGWIIDSLKLSNNVLTAIIPVQNPLTEVEYKLKILYKSKEYFIPSTETQKVLFLGQVPKTILIYYYLTLFVGLLLSLKTGLEYFNNKPRIRLFSIFTLISFFSCAFIFAPVKKAYEMGIIGKSVPPINKLFQAWLLLLVFFWIVETIVVSSSKYKTKYALIFSIMTLIVFLTQDIW